MSYLQSSSGITSVTMRGEMGSPNGTAWDAVGFWNRLGEYLWSIQVESSDANGGKTWESCAQSSLQEQS